MPYASASCKLDCVVVFNSDSKTHHQNQHSHTHQTQNNSYANHPRLLRSSPSSSSSLSSLGSSPQSTHAHHHPHHHADHALQRPQDDCNDTYDKNSDENDDEETVLAHAVASSSFSSPPQPHALKMLQRLQSLTLKTQHMHERCAQRLAIANANKSLFALVDKLGHLVGTTDGGADDAGANSQSFCDRSNHRSQALDVFD
jgi:hypothetical protein